MPKDKNRYFLYFLATYQVCWYSLGERPQRKPLCLKATPEINQDCQDAQALGTQMTHPSCYPRSGNKVQLLPDSDKWPHGMLAQWFPAPDIWISTYGLKNDEGITWATNSSWQKANLWFREKVVMSNLLWSFFYQKLFWDFTVNMTLI